MKLPALHPITCALLALACLLAACGGAGTGGAAPTSGPIVRDTSPAAPTQPAQPSAMPLPSASSAPTVLVLPTIAIATPAGAPPSATPAGAASMLIGYHKTGGIAGIDEMLTVYADGTVETSDKSGTTRSHADPNTIQALQTLLASPEFAALQVPMQPPVPDQFVYELTLPGRTKPLVATDSADNPPVLRKLIDMLEQLKTQAR